MYLLETASCSDIVHPDLACRIGGRHRQRVAFQEFHMVSLYFFKLCFYLESQTMLNISEWLRDPRSTHATAVQKPTWTTTAVEEHPTSNLKCVF